MGITRSAAYLPVELLILKTMKRSLLLLSATALVFSLANCTTSSGGRTVNVVSTSSYSKLPATTQPVYTINGVPLHHYSPDTYTPFAYDHQGLAHNDYYQKRAIWNEQRARRGSVEVGPVEAESN